MKKLFGYSWIWEENFSEKGFIQGIGFSVQTKVLRIFGLKFITSIKFQGTGEWLRDIKIRWEKDEKQQHLEKSRAC